jgi:hypothetical protein
MLVASPAKTFCFWAGRRTQDMLLFGRGFEEDRQSRAVFMTARGKSELHRAGCWLTASGGDPKESATETYRLAFLRPGKGEMVR